jgi:hypothetical protein
LKKITILQFKNFIRRQNKDENYFYEIISKCMVNIKTEYQKEYSEDKKELNIVIIEPIILKCYTKIIYSELDKIEDN